MKRFLFLSLEDVEPIALSPVKTSNGDVVYQELVNASHKTGTPIAIVGDKGPDLHCALWAHSELWRGCHPVSLVVKTESVLFVGCLVVELDENIGS